MSAPLAYLLVVLASYRATRFLVHDDLLAEIRHRWWERFPTTGTGPVETPMWRHKLGDLVECPFCWGYWVSGAMLAVGHAVGIVGWAWRYDLVCWWAVAGGQALLNAIDFRVTNG